MRASSHLAIIVALLTLVLAACGSAGTSGSKEPMKIGLLASLSGSLAAGDTSNVHAINLAVSEINSNGGAKGHQIQLIPRDVASSPANFVTSANQLINNNNAGALLGLTLSAGCSAVLPIAKSQQTPEVADCVLSGDQSWGFNLITPPQSGYVPPVASLATQTLKASKIAVIHTANPYGQANSDALKDLATKEGMTVTADIPTELTATDLSPQLLRARDSGAQVIADFMYQSSNLALAQSAGALGLNLPVIASYDNQDIFKQMAAKYPNMYFIVTPAQRYPQIADPTLKSAAGKYVSAFQKSYPKDPGVALAGVPYDGVHIIAAAVEQCDCVSGAALKNAIEHVKIQGAATAYSFTPSDHSGQATAKNPFAAVRLKPDGAMTMQWEAKS